MAQYVITTSRSEAENLRRVCNVSRDMPLRGTRVGGGIHVPMPATWDGSGAVPLGWTVATDVIENPERDGRFAVDVEPADESKLSAGDRTTIQAARTRATTQLDWSQRIAEGRAR